MTSIHSGVEAVCVRWDRDERLVIDAAGEVGRFGNG